MVKVVVHILKILALLLFSYSQIQASVEGSNHMRIDESMCLSTDRDIYIAGEKVLVAIDLYSKQVVEAQSGVGYILIRNINQQIIHKATVRIVNGHSTCCIALSDTLSSGYYQIVGFTNYMRNFGEEYFATKQLLIINRFDNDFDSVVTVLPDSVSNSHIDSTFYNSDTLGYFNTTEEVYVQMKGKEIPFKNILNVSVVQSICY